MKSLKLVVIGLLSLCVSQMQAMEVKVKDVTTESADHITEDSVIKKAEKDAA